MQRKRERKKVKSARKGEKKKKKKVNKIFQEVTSDLYTTNTSKLNNSSPCMLQINISFPHNLSLIYMQIHNHQHFHPSVSKKSIKGYQSLIEICLVLTLFKQTNYIFLLFTLTILMFNSFKCFYRKNGLISKVEDCHTFNFLVHSITSVLLSS